MHYLIVFMSTLFAIPTQMLPLAALFSNIVSPYCLFIIYYLLSILPYHVILHVKSISFCSHFACCLYSTILLFYHSLQQLFLVFMSFPAFLVLDPSSDLGSALFGAKVIMLYLTADLLL
jgi:hypothetical protein